MRVGRLLFVIPLLIAGVAIGESNAPCNDYRHLAQRSWVITEAHVRTNGSPATIKRKVTVTVDPSTGRRAIEESRWVNDAFEPVGAPRVLDDGAVRGFDDLGLTPASQQDEQVLTIGRKRYVCTVATYVIAGEGRSTTLTLWRDQSGATQLPPRTLSINNKDLPLPADALQADFVVEGQTVSSKGERRIASLAAPLRVNGQTCNCLVEETRLRGTSNGKPLALDVREWYCHDLPGERLRTLTSMTSGAMQVESDVAVLDFHVARPDASAVHASPQHRGSR